MVKYLNLDSYNYTIANPRKPKIFVYETGGTIVQKKEANGALKVNNESLKNKLGKFANIDVFVGRMTNPIDSTNMEHEHRKTIAKMIFEYAQYYDGFVIIHGTDTMASTAAALPYMIQGLGKPVVLTGSILPIENIRSEGLINVNGAIEIATMDFGEVVIASRDGIYRGVRAEKTSTSDFNAFGSPKIEPLGSIGKDITLKDHRICRFESDIKLFTEFDTNISVFYPGSGVNPNDFNILVNSPEIHGFIIAGFGKGNVPEKYYTGLKRAVELNKPVVIVTRCAKGTADGTYEVGAIPLDIGAISGKDMTITAATQKLMYALGKAVEEIANKRINSNEIIEYVKKIIHTPIGFDIS